MNEKIKKYLNFKFDFHINIKISNFYPAIISFLISATLTYVFMWIDVERTNATIAFKKEFKRIERSLIDSGYDLAYEKISFNKLYPFNLVSIKDLRIYKPVQNDYFEILIPEFSISTGLFNPQKASFDLGSTQSITIGNKRYTSSFRDLDINLGFDAQSGLKNIIVEGKNIVIKNFASIETFKLASRRIAPLQINELTPFFENFVEINNINLDNSVDFPLSKHIERIYLNANVIGLMPSQETYNESFEVWVNLGGTIDIKKLVLNWSPLILVSRGDLYFTEKSDFILHLNTSSKALIPTLASLQENGYLENKGMFVVKILLANKSFKINREDNFYTVTTPVEIKNKQLFIENIKVAN